MAKKKTTVRRVPRSSTPRTFGDGRPSEQAAAEGGALGAGVEQAVATRTNGTTTRPASPEFRRRVPSARGIESRPQLPLREEYGYVPGDLKRLGLVASGMVVLMLVLGLILH